jgi:hypothetical protein
MSLQAAVKKNKKGLSVIIGYVLLMVISIVMSAIVYQWLKTYVPKDTAICSDGTSMFIQEVNYDCTGNILTVTVKNNGRFSIDGYFIHVSNKSEEKIGTIDLAPRLITASSQDLLEQVSGSEVRFTSIANSLSPEDGSNTNVKSFNVSSYGTLYKIEIIPVRIQEVDNQKRIVGCSSAKSEESLVCN